LKLFKEMVVGDKKNLDLVESEMYKLKTYYMALVDDENRMTFYDGKVRVIDPQGKEFALFDPKEYVEHIGEWVEPWTFIRLTHLKKLGWKGLIEGDETSLYRVAPLARLNVADGMATPLAQKESEIMFDVLGGKPAHHTLAMHWARLICALQAAEHNLLIADSPILTSKDIRNMNMRLRRSGVGCVEAPRGTLFHHYEVDDRGILTMVNLLVATQNNAGPICMSIKKAAKGLIKGGQVREGLLNRIEMAFRAYDPCLSCATHALPGKMPLEVRIRNRAGELIRTVRRD
jgi:F420-non-reducing hydrogenase large subunit